MILGRTHLALFAAIALSGTAAACATRVDASELGPSTLKRSTGDSSDEAQTGGSATTTTTTSSSGSTPASATTTTAATTAPAVDPFAGAPAFATITPALDSSQQHQGDSNAGKDCLSCHGANNGAPTFAMAGTVRETAGQDDGATGVQVRIVGPDGTEIALVGTDSVGSFWLKGTATIPAGSHVGIRDGSTEKKMSGTISAGSCNTAGCHDPTRPLFLNAAQ